MDNKETLHRDRQRNRQALLTVRRFETSFPCRNHLLPWWYLRSVWEKSYLEDHSGACMWSSLQPGELQTLFSSEIDTGEAGAER